MVIPWVGFPLGPLHQAARADVAREVRRVHDQAGARPRCPASRRGALEWPYVEGLRMDEAMHPLTILAVGLYGRVLPNQNGAPIRLVVPWKYGFKSIKSIVKIRFVEQQPPTTWNRQAPGEYGFYSNVNPEVDHPRWSQARERRIGELARRKTLPFNGYGERGRRPVRGHGPAQAVLTVAAPRRARPHGSRAREGGRRRGGAAPRRARSACSLSSTGDLGAEPDRRGDEPARLLDADRCCWPRSRRRRSRS